MNRLTTFLTLPAFFFVFASFGCTSDNEPRAVRVLNYADLGPPPSAAYSVGAFRSNDHASPSDLERPSPAPRMIIKTASISVEVADYERAVADIQKAVNERHGFTVTSTTQYSNRNSKSGNMRIRIPSSEFDATLESIMKVSSQVFSKTISGNDVTEEFFDVSARLRNKQMVESRFRETLRLAKSVKDILAVEESLGNIREEIEQLEGRRKFLVDQTALSTIDASLREPNAFVDVDQSFWGKVADGFHKGVRDFGDVVSFIVTMVIAGFPIMIILLILAFVALSVVKLRRSGRRHA